jgi:hypothetical protein
VIAAAHADTCAQTLRDAGEAVYAIGTIVQAQAGGPKVTVQ